MVKKSFVSLAFIFSSLVLISHCEANDKKRDEKTELENTEARKRAAIASLHRKQIEAEKKAAWEKRKKELQSVTVDLLPRFNEESPNTSVTDFDGMEISNNDEGSPTTPVSIKRKNNKIH